MNNAQATGWNTRRTCRKCSHNLVLIGVYLTCEREHGNLTGWKWNELPKATKLPKKRFRIQGKDGLWERAPHSDCGRSTMTGQVFAACREYGAEYAVAMALIPYDPPPRRVPYVHGAKCSVSGCYRMAARGCRGMCRSCVTKARALVESGEASWDNIKMKPAAFRHNGRSYKALSGAITARRMAPEAAVKTRGVRGTCLVPGCDRKSEARGICRSCYNSAVLEIQKYRTSWSELENLGLAIKPM